MTGRRISIDIIAERLKQIIKEPMWAPEIVAAAIKRWPRSMMPKAIHSTLSRHPDFEVVEISNINNGASNDKVKKWRVIK